MPYYFRSVLLLWNSCFERGCLGGSKLNNLNKSGSFLRIILKLKTMKILYSLLLISTLISCNKNSEQEKYQQHRNNVIDVSSQVIDTKIDTKLMFGGQTILRIIKDYLIVCDYQSPEKGIHLFNKNTFEYITSTGLRGEGPREIIRYGDIGIDNENGIFYVLDFGKMTAFKFVLDSVLINPDYMPSKSFSLIKDLFPAIFDFVSDSVIIGKGLDILDNQNFNSTLVKYNIRTEAIEKIGEPSPNIDTKNRSTFFALSKEHAICVETFADYDLMTIRDLEGNTIDHVYGPQWGVKERNYQYFSTVTILNDKIIAAFLGAQGMVQDEHKRITAVFPTKLLVFDIHGEYLHTIETRGDIFHFCADPDNNRIIISFYDRENQFGYIDLNKL